MAEARLDSGDLLVMYTDGITEAASETGEEFGENRLQELLLAHHHRPVSELLDTIMTTVKRFSGPEQADDFTLVIARARERA